jgi:nucleotide-binding universal stress UspA family protein
VTTAVYRQVIVGTDGSPTAASAVRTAASLALRLTTPLLIVTAWYRRRDDAPVTSEEARYPGGSAPGHEARWAETTTSDAAAVARSLGVEDVRQLTPTGGATDALIDLSEQRPGSLTVVGTAGLAERAERFVGNVAHQLTHHSRGDVFLAGYRDGDGARSWGSVALATDGSPTAAVACEHGYAVARQLGVDPILLTVASDQGHGDAVLDRASGQFPDGRSLPREVAIGADVSRTLVDAATAYDLVVIGNKGMSGPSRLLGSVSNRVTHEVPTDLLLVNTSR